MFEHVGLKNLPQYFKIVQRILKPGGVFLNHGIARSYSSPTRKNSFIDRYVFPDGELVPLCEALEAAESRGLEVRDVENLREHYELTLRRWVEGLRQNADTVLRHVPEVAYRVWLLYMAGSAAAFRRGDIGVYQVLLSRPDRGASYRQLRQTFIEALRMLATTHEVIEIQDVCLDLVIQSVSRQVGHSHHVEDGGWIPVTPLDDHMQRRFQIGRR